MLHRVVFYAYESMPGNGVQLLYLPIFEFNTRLENNRYKTACRQMQIN